MSEETCYAYCLANNFDFAELVTQLENRYRVVRYKEVVRIEKTTGEAIIFPYGVIVTWGLNYNDLQALLDETSSFRREPFATPIIDEFTFCSGSEKYRIHSDHIAATSDDPLEKIAVSHGIAQSVKLTEFEQKAQKTIDETTYIPKDIALKGSTRLSRKELSKMRGELYLVKSSIHLHFDLLDTPEFFWEYPEFQDTYMATTKYLEVDQRIEVLTKKLNVIHELFIMLSDEQQHKHSSTLEWIIIWLIVIEIVLFVIKDIFGT